MKMNLTSKSFEMVFEGFKSSSTKTNRYKTAINFGFFVEDVNRQLDFQGKICCIFVVDFW